MPPPMYRRETRFKGQKRVSVGRTTRNSDPPEFRSKERVILKQDSTRDESYENLSNMVKSEPNFNTRSTDPTVPDIQMNDDLQERDESLVRSDDRNFNLVFVIEIIGALMFIHSFIPTQTCYSDKN